MIFVAVGTQFTFDRLVKVMDEWALEQGERVVIQTARGDYVPQHCEAHDFMDAEQYNALIAEAELFVSHAGMGNIISARKLGTPILVMNRQFALGEHRNDHQKDGIQWMSQIDGVYTADSNESLLVQLSQRASFVPADSIESVHLSQLQGFLRDYINAR